MISLVLVLARYNYFDKFLETIFGSLTKSYDLSQPITQIEVTTTSYTLTQAQALDPTSYYTCAVSAHNDGGTTQSKHCLIPSVKRSGLRSAV
jgi:hypothetical protein